MKKYAEVRGAEFQQQEIVASGYRVLIGSIEK
jgi:hypothetical protein